MANKIITRGYVGEVTSHSAIEPNRCATRQIAIQWGGVVPYECADNQLIYDVRAKLHPWTPDTVIDYYSDVYTCQFWADNSFDMFASDMGCSDVSMVKSSSIWVAQGNYIYTNPWLPATSGKKQVLYSSMSNVPMNIMFNNKTGEDGGWNLTRTLYIYQANVDGTYIQFPKTVSVPEDDFEDTIVGFSVTGGDTWGGQSNLSSEDSQHVTFHIGLKSTSESGEWYASSATVRFTVEYEQAGSFTIVVSTAPGEFSGSASTFRPNEEMTQLWQDFIAY